MDIKELITKINKSAEELDFVTTRRYIEGNIEVLNQNKNLLRGNARELLTFLTNRLNSGEEALSRAEMAVIHSINTYANKFDIRSIKIVIKNNQKLLLKKEFVDYLNADAKIILEGMGAIEKKGNV